MKKKYCAGKPMRSGQDPVCRPGRRAVLLVSLLLVLTMAVGGTVAFLAARTEQKTNTFAPSRVASQVIEEHFDGEVKSDAAVRNTGDTTAYIRAAVSITWMQDTDAASQTITARSPREGVDYTISYLADTGWLRGDDGFWYHQTPVAPGKVRACSSAAATSCRGRRCPRDIICRWRSWPRPSSPLRRQWWRMCGM